MKRVFAAIKIIPGQELLQLYFELKKIFITDRINWVKENNIHITIKFYGDVYDSQIKEISRLLKNVCNHHAPFYVDLRNLGVFGSKYNPRVIWVGLEHTDYLKKLSFDVLNKSQAIGFGKDRQNFVPHITLGRIKQVDDKEKLRRVTTKYSNKVFQTVNIDQIFLYESKLLRTGSIYSLITSFDMMKKSYNI